MFDTHNLFDPATADTEFTFTTSDYALTVFGEPLSRAVHAEAPGVRLRFHQITVPAVDDIGATLAGTDGLFMPHGYLAGYPSVDLYEDRWSCMVAADNAGVDEHLTREHLARLPWVVLHHRPTDYAPALRQLTILGVEPHVDVVVENFQSMPFLVAGTDRIALIQERLARKIAPAAEVRLLECPFEVVPVKEAMRWHPTHRQDARHQWLRDIVARVGDQVTAH
ncbi:DNA-binding transcriptional LysR family regulator [Saccharopolyspora lacisalsi]|uniref:DNA-binding transcriptional LysR family regulator n=1 Tax=Halosaccharopolyspora lacisalsi TaxID=1000566 RepID=A0A839E1F3_9PSEU|nr:DNA-binding transcriptional LysR family regulator [Halosaccharopolyspora lacisalsi]